MGVCRTFVLLCVVAGSAWATSAAELPPEIQADRYLVQAERQAQAGQSAAAVATLDRILALQADHGLEIPAAFWFKHAEASLAAGLFDQAIGSSTEYIRHAGRDGEHYLAALKVLDAAEFGKATLPGRTFRDALASGGEGPVMVVIPAGAFLMGMDCPSSDENCLPQEPVHEVTIRAPFALSRYKVTFAEWDACVAAGGCDGNEPSDADWIRGMCPVMGVSWDNAREFVSWLSAQTGADYRLPTESEWEYAARAGKTTTKYTRRERGQGCGIGWDDSFTAPVGSFRPNDFGLHDMDGHVGEWLADCWNSSYEGAPSDGSAWLSGNCDVRVMRGTAPWFLDDSYAAFREARGPRDVDFFTGFRVARMLTP